MTLIKIKSANRVIQILELLASQEYGIQHKDLAEELEIPKGSLTKLLSNLIDMEYVTFDITSNTYRLSSRVLLLASSYLSKLDIVQVAQPILRDLVAKTGESCALAILDGDSAVNVHRQHGTKPMSYRVGIGSRIPLYATACGKAILAFMSKEELEHYLSSVKLSPLTPTTITTRSALLRELKSIRSEHLAFSRQEQFQGLSAMAAPIFRMNGRVAAALTVMYLDIHAESIDFSLFKRALKEASDALSAHLGFRRE